MRLRVTTSLFFAATALAVYAAPLHTGAQAVPALPPAMEGWQFPALPALPALPNLPAVPAEASFPAAPAVSATPSLPEMPALPVSPDDWDHGHSVSLGGGRREPAADCGDLRIRFDGADAVVKSEEHTVTKAEAPTLRVHPHTNGGVQVVGWDKDVYSVTACKAASDSDHDAERVLAQIRVSVQGGEISTDGPRNDEDDWTVYLLIRAPKSATIDLETKNGPLSVYSMDGKLTAHAINGPISLREFTGDATVQATNGPISVTGSSGNVNIHTQNGPISVNLMGKSWNGTGLSADAQNGPVTLFVPSDYQSSFVVEASRYGPISCRASICDNARKTWDDGHRRIEFGNSPAIIHLSTVNGPVSVQSPRGEM